MLATLVIIIAVLIAALLGIDAYEYDGHYREAAWEKAKHQASDIEHTVDKWLGSRRPLMGHARSRTPSALLMARSLNRLPA
jgi:hypothetical protein